MLVGPFVAICSVNHTGEQQKLHASDMLQELVNHACPQKQKKIIAIEFRLLLVIHKGLHVVYNTERSNCNLK